MTGAFGEEIVQYKGFQTTAEVGMGPERKVYLGAYRYRAGGELLYHHDGTKEVAFTDNNGSVRLVVRQNGTAFDTLHFDYKPFGDTLWTSAGTMNRDNFNGSTYDAESDLQMMGFRMYDNETGRFTTPDLLWSAFPAQTPYHYAFNSPLTYRDPTGLAPEKEKEREELQHMITLNDLIIGNLIYAAFISAIKSSSVYSPSAIPDGRRDEVDKLIYISARTASASYSFNGVSISMGFDGKPAGVFFNYTLQITVDKKVLNMPVSIAVDKSDGKHLFKIKETMDGYMNNLKASAMKILSADISYFDPMMGGNYNIIIESGAKIAKFHNSENGKNFTHLAGLHTSHGDNSATFRLAKEVFKDGGDKDYRYTNEFGRGSRLQVWDTFAHEVAHELDLLNYGRELYDHSGIIGDVAKEIFAERRVNWLRFLSNKPRSIYP
ncbi:MAG: RHS repeat-associated core domain-containing protein [Ignavibacteriae bacterium]|nr:RHS repeat-associated core domain-containing protein [Ignavibacteriota bacterium]